MDLNLDTLQMPWVRKDMPHGGVDKPGSSSSQQSPINKNAADHFNKKAGPKPRKKKRRVSQTGAREQDIPTIDSLPLVADVDSEWLTV